jgi:hypothetical protein
MNPSIWVKVTVDPGLDGHEDGTGAAPAKMRLGTPY